MSAQPSTEGETTSLRRYKGIAWRSGNEIFPFEDGPLHEMWVAPLNGVTRAISGHSRAQFFDPSDFMIMAGILRRGRPPLILYKHYWTRRYLNLDDAGHAYRYIPPKDLYRTKSNGRYVAHRGLIPAIDHLQLWLLPWMKPGLEHEQRGIEFEDAKYLGPWPST